MQQEGIQPMRSLFHLALLACVLPGSALAAGVNWPQPGRNAQHTGYNAKETVLNTSNVSSLALSWTATTNAEIDAPIVTAGGKLFVLSTDGTLYAYGAMHGNLLWSVVVNKNGAPSNWGVLASGGTVYANCQLDYDGSPWGGHGGLCAYSAATGAPLWSYAIYDDGPGNPVDSAPYGAPVLDGANIALGEADSGSFFHVGYFVVLNAKTGVEVAGIGNCGDTGANDCNLVSPGVPSAQKGTVYYDSGDANAPPGYQGAFVALPEESGAPSWYVYTTDAGIAPAIASGKILFQENNNDGATSSLVALNEATGGQLWSTQVAHADYGHIAPAVAKGLAYFSVDGNLYALSLSNGKVKWSYPSTGAAGALTTGVSIANGVVYAQCHNGGNNLCMFDAATGAYLSGIGAGSGSPSAPIVLNGAIYTACNYNSVCRYVPSK
jgi:outer membrane protein assembly factor BamB